MHLYRVHKGALSKYKKLCARFKIDKKLKELIADATIKMKRDEIFDGRLFSLVKEVLNYDAKHF